MVKQLFSKRLVLMLLTCVLSICAWAQIDLSGYKAKGTLPTSEFSIEAYGNSYYIYTPTTDVMLTLERTDGNSNVTVYSQSGLTNGMNENYLNSWPYVFLLNKDTKYYILVDNYSDESCNFTPGTSEIIDINSGETKEINAVACYKITNNSGEEQLLKISRSDNVYTCIYNSNISSGSENRYTMVNGESVFIYAYLSYDSEGTITPTLSTPQEGETKSMAKTLSITDVNNVSEETWFKYTCSDADAGKYLVITYNDGIGIGYESDNVGVISCFDNISYCQMNAADDYYIRITSVPYATSFSAKLSTTEPICGSREYPTTDTWMNYEDTEKWIKWTSDGNKGKLSVIASSDPSNITGIQLYTSNAEDATPIATAEGAPLTLTMSVDANTTYYIKVTKSSETDGEYIDINFAPEGETKEYAKDLKTDGTINTTISYNDTWFKFTSGAEDEGKYLVLYSEERSFGSVYYDEGANEFSGGDNLRYITLSASTEYYIEMNSWESMSFKASVVDEEPLIGTAKYPIHTYMGNAQYPGNGDTEWWYVINTENNTSLTVETENVSGIYIYKENSESAEPIASVTGAQRLEVTGLAKNTAYYVKITKAAEDWAYIYFDNLDIEISKVYLGNGTEVSGKKLLDWPNIQSTYPNAIAIISNDGSNIWANNQSNVIIDYQVGTNGHYYECPNLVLTDLSDFYSPVDFTALTGSYSRTGVSGTYASVCLPFALTSDNIGGGKFLTFSNYNSTNANVYFSEHDAIDAGVPCIVTDYSTDWNITFDNTEIKADPISSTNMQGSYISKTIGENHYKLVSAGDKFGKTTSEGSVSPFRAYLDIDTSLGLETNGNAAKALNIFIGNEDASSIEATEAASVLSGSVYSVNGVQKQSITKGINIIKSNDGKVRKVIVK